MDGFQEYFCKNFMTLSNFASASAVFIAVRERERVSFIANSIPSFSHSKTRPKAPLRVYLDKKINPKGMI